MPHGEPAPAGQRDRYRLNSAELESGEQEHSLDAAARRAWEEYAAVTREAWPVSWETLGEGKRAAWRCVVAAVIARLEIRF